MRSLAADLARLWQVLRVAVAHLLAAAVAGRPRWRWLARRLPGPGLDGPQRLRTAFEELGGTYIKFGQMLALQPDILSLRYCNALFKLLDRVEPFAYDDVRRTFVEDLGRPPEEVFDDFETEPFAAASVGQVHRARLGERRLAVKVRRPTVLTDFAGDLRLMRFAMRWIRRLRLRPFYWVLEPMGEFVTWTREELDYRTEARYLERLRANARNNPRERVPAVVDELSGERILAMDFLEGVAVLDYVRAVEEGDEVTVRRLADDGFEPDAFARAVIENFLSDAFLHGLFHADLHPANLLILPGNVVGYVDFGITGVLSAYSRRHLVAMTLAYTRGDLDGMSEAFLKVATVAPGSDPAVFRRGLGRLSTSWYDVRGGRRRLNKNFTLVMLDMLRLSRQTGVWPERDVVKYIRSAIAIDGLIERFAPGFDVGHYLERVCARHLRGSAWRELVARDRLLAMARAGGRLGLETPHRLDAALERWTNAAPAAGAATGAEAGRSNSAAPLALALFALVAALFAAADPGGATLGWNLFTAQSGLAAAALILLLRSTHRSLSIKEATDA